MVEKDLEVVVVAKAAVVDDDHVECVCVDHGCGGRGCGGCDCVGCEHVAHDHVDCGCVDHALAITAAVAAGTILVGVNGCLDCEGGLESGSGGRGSGGRGSGGRANGGRVLVSGYGGRVLESGYGGRGH